jgi:hypothetical protein
MSLKAINWMAKQTTGDDKMKSALFWLAFHLNDETGECFPSISTLQAEMEVKSDNTVRGALRRLREAGFISWERETKDGLTVKTNYHLHMNGSMAEGTSASNGTSTIAVPQPLREGTSTVEGGTSTIAGGVLQPVRTNREIEQGINRERNRESSMRTSGNSSANAAVASAQAQTPYPEDFDQSLFEEAMLATQDSEQAPEALPDPDADLPPKKQRRSQQPRVPFPETLPDDWAEAAKIARPDIDPQRVFLKLRARYAPTTTKKTLATWKREFMNWIGKEFAYDNRYRSSAQKPQRTLGATDTRSLNHRNFGKWASHAV